MCVLKYEYRHVEKENGLRVQSEQWLKFHTIYDENPKEKLNTYGHLKHFENLQNICITFNNQSCISVLK